MTTRTVTVGDGRRLCLDDVGDPVGLPVLYLHGTPDSRLARPGDDRLAAGAGVRLLALDRPGYGGSDPLPATDGGPVGAGPAGPGPVGGWAAMLATQVDAALDTLGVERCAVLTWSGGTLAGLALSAALPDRVAALGVVTGVAPRQAFDDPTVRAAGSGWLDTIELADAMPPGELGEAMAPLMAPYPCDRALALEHQAERRSPASQRELATVPGAAERMADALVEATRQGLAGVAADIEALGRPLPLDLGAVAPPVRLWYGTDDTVTPPAIAHWYAHHLPSACLELIEGGAHYLLFTHWEQILGALRRDARA